MSKGAVAGIAVGGAVRILLLALIVYVVLYRRKKVAQVTLLHVPVTSQDQYSQLQHGCGSSLGKATESSVVAFPRLTGITIDKSVEFPYEELAKATDGFSIANIIGQGGFGSVYYAELRNEDGMTSYGELADMMEKGNIGIVGKTMCNRIRA